MIGVPVLDAKIHVALLVEKSMLPPVQLWQPEPTQRTLAVIVPLEMPEPSSSSNCTSCTLGGMCPDAVRGLIVTFVPAAFWNRTNMFAPAIWLP